MKGHNFKEVFLRQLTFAQKTETINHEFGHIQQEKDLGTFAYTLAVFIPSATYNVLSRDNALKKYYTSMPWEYNADIRGGVTRTTGYEPWAQRARNIYWDIVEVIF